MWILLTPAKIQPLAGVLLCLAWLVLGPVACNQPSPEQAARQLYLAGSVYPGQGIEQIRIGQTTYAELVTRFGPEFSESFQAGSRSSCNAQGECEQRPYQQFTIAYAEAGMSFEFTPLFAPDTDKTRLKIERIFVRCLSSGECPFTGQTRQGIGLGATREALHAAHGKPLSKAHNSWLNLYSEGLGFGFKSAYQKPKPTDPVESIQVLAPSATK